MQNKTKCENDAQKGKLINAEVGMLFEMQDAKWRVTGTEYINGSVLVSKFEFVGDVKNGKQNLVV